MESSHLVIFSTSGKFITKFNVLRCISLSETPFWTGARGRIPITLKALQKRSFNDFKTARLDFLHTSFLSQRSAGRKATSFTTTGFEIEKQL